MSEGIPPSSKPRPDPKKPSGKSNPTSASAQKPRTPGNAASVPGQPSSSSPAKPPSPAQVPPPPVPRQAPEIPAFDMASPTSPDGLGLPMTGGNEKEDLYEAGKPGEVSSHDGLDLASPAEPEALGLPMTGESEKEDLYDVGKPGEVTTRDGLNFDSDELADSTELVELFHLSPLIYLLLTGLVFANVIVTGLDYIDMPLLKGTTPTAVYGAVAFWLLVSASIQVAMSIGAGWGCYNLFGRSMRAANAGLIVMAGLCLVILYGIHTKNAVEKESRKALIAEEAEAAAQKRKEEMEAQAAAATAAAESAAKLAPAPAPIVETPVQPAPAPAPAPQPQAVAAAPSPAPPTAKPRHHRSSSAPKAPGTLAAGPGGAAAPTPSPAGSPTPESDDEDEFPELNIADPTPNDIPEEVAIKQAKKNYIEQLKPLLGTYKTEAELFRDAGGLDFRTLSAPDLIDDRIKILYEIRAAYEPYTKFVALTNINIQLQLEKSKINEGKTIKVIDELLSLLDKYKYDPSHSKDLLVLTRISTILIQVKHLSPGWKPSDDGRSLIDKGGKPLEQLNEYIANTRKIAAKTSIFKFLE